MKLLALSLLAVSMSALATQPADPLATASSASIGVGLAASRSTSSATGGASVISNSGNSQAFSSNSATYGAISGGSGGSVDLAGARMGNVEINTPRQTPPSFSPEARTPVSIISCRLVMGSGGATDKVSFALGIPIGNDGLCLHAKRDGVMKSGNARRPGTFSDDDFLRNDCTVEGMAETSACKALAERDAGERRAAVSHDVAVVAP